MTIARILTGWGINVSIALVALRTNMMRSILTTVGVTIGVLSVVLAVAVGQGAKASVTESINALGSNMAIVFPQPENRTGRRSIDRGRLTERDAIAVEKQVEGVGAVAPQLRTTVQLVFAGRNATTIAFGVTPEYARIANVEVDSGRLVSDNDVRAAARVAVLGETVAGKLFGSFDPIGQTVRIARIPFKIIGVLTPKGSSLGVDNDDVVLVPITAARQRFASTVGQGPDDLSVLFVGFVDGVNLAVAKRDMIRVIRARNNIRNDDVSPFTVNTTEEFLKQSSSVTSVLQVLLVAIASISLLVGGIGIMNIMLVSVTERTREIGLRMALGATVRDIRNQFLVEAAALCVIGGTIGLILAITAAALFERYAEFSVPISFDTAVGAIAFSAVIGLIFGGWPAVRASRLSPIEALRSE